ncbi:Hypothetical protein mma_2223 [Janthinobacterium sp. Marseille]|nr:hypothetical protein [Janthinobacterium sp. Marseille]ABR91896.1 Hypothetical protein mma_2223 [Janthinobacterium sp. Marseille]
MAYLSSCHKELNELGDGCCSVPMFSGGCPAGFCDRPAYGFRPEMKTHRRWDGFEWRDDGKYTGYVPGLACVAHGGPDSRVFKDGNMFCAVYPDFIDLQASISGFGETPELARLALSKARH